MSLTVIFGKPGYGKSALLTSFIRKEYLENGYDIERACCSRIDEINSMFKRSLTMPCKVPIFTDYKVKFLAGYKKYYETYFTNGFYFGLPHDDQLPTIYLPPYSIVGLTEVQRYYDSRKKNLPSWVSRTFEMHRHYGLSVYLDLQRLLLLDKNIRDNCEKFIEVQEMRHKLNVFGGIIYTEWICREWDNNTDVEQYLNNRMKNFKTVKYLYDGDIFSCYDSYNYKDKFLPPKGKDFTYLSHIDDVCDVKENLQQLYDFSEPLGYR